MKNPYILPVCFAAAAHGALLFGFTKGPVAAKPPKEIITCHLFEIKEVEPEPPVVEVDSSSALPKPAPEMPQPIRSPEPPAIETRSDFTITPPPIPPPGTEEMRQILEFKSGAPDGIGEAIAKEGVFSLGLLDNTPRTRFQVSPTYPFEARRGGVHGEVFVDFTVDEQGRVLDPRVVKSSHAMFDEPTLRAVAKWQFEPGKRNGRIVKFRMTVPVLFNLNEGP
jgi:periplasmic protein TonB